MNTSDYLLEAGKDDRTAIIEASGARSYADLRAAAARLAGELISLGLEPGARVGIVGRNSLFWAAAYLAAMKVGCVAVPFSTMTTSEEMGANAAWAGCEAVFMDRRMLREFGSAFSPAVRLVHDEVLEKAGPSEWPSPDGSPGSGDAALMFTSGTTAKPKAVRVTHDNIQANTDSIVEYLGLRGDDRMLVILPFFYCFGTSLLHTHLRVGGSLALCNSFTFPETAIDMMEKQGCTGFAGVPSSYQLLLRISTFKSRSLPKLRLLQQAGGNLHRILLEELIASKPEAKIFVMYGQTEATARLSYLPPDKLPAKLGSIGKGLHGTELSVIGEDGRPVAPGQVGEIVARGRNISPGYYNDPEATASKFAEGALRTGDLATVDEEGYIYIVDRKDDFIKSWGYRVSSQEVESCALGLPDVVSAAAVGIPDLEAGEAIHLFVTLRPGSPVGEAEVMARCREGLAKHMVPKRVAVIDRMPLNANGKIVKGELRKRAAT